MASRFFKAENSFAAAFCAAVFSAYSAFEKNEAVIMDAVIAASVFVLCVLLCGVSLISIIGLVVTAVLIITGENLISDQRRRWRKA